jgi:protein transport protein SEC61 subunit gamma and related proteins
MQKLNSFIIECKRVLMITKKPDKTEFQTTLKVAGLGILLLGALGFILFILKQLIMQFFS